MDYDVCYISQDGKVLLVEVPGFTKENLEITQKGSKVYIFGEYTCDVFGYRKVNKEFTLGRSFKIDKATLKNGELFIFLKENDEGSSKISIE